MWNPLQRYKATLSGYGPIHDEEGCKAILLKERAEALEIKKQLVAEHKAKKAKQMNLLDTETDSADEIIKDLPPALQDLPF